MGYPLGRQQADLGRGWDGGDNAVFTAPDTAACSFHDLQTSRREAGLKERNNFSQT